MEKHFKLCSLIEYKCLFCNNIIKLMNLEEHVLNKCTFGIINYSDKSKYIGEKKIIKEKDMEYYIVPMEQDTKENLMMKI